MIARISNWPGSVSGCERDRANRPPAGQGTLTSEMGQERDVEAAPPCPVHPSTDDNITYSPSRREWDIAVANPLFIVSFPHSHTTRQHPQRRDEDPLRLLDPHRPAAPALAHSPLAHGALQPEDVPASVEKPSFVWASSRSPLWVSMGTRPGAWCRRWS